MTFFSLPDFSPLPPQAFPPIKGVTAFCEDSALKGRPAEDGSVRLCITKRRIIQFYSLWHDGISEPKVRITTLQTETTSLFSMYQFGIFYLEVC
jgi:hypothetical protein